MKKPSYIVMGALMLALCAGSFGACAKGGHTHVFSDKWNSTADSHWHYCTVSGCNVRGDEDEHSNWELVKTTTAPTCYASGVGEYACGICGYKKTDIIPATGEHVFDGDWEYQKGSDRHFKRCATRGCSARYTEPHVPGKLTWKASATLFEDGYSTIECTECGAELQRVIDPATGVAHSFDVSFLLGISVPAGTPDRSQWTQNDPLPFFFFNDDSNSVASGLEPDDMWHVYLVKDSNDSSTYGYRLNFVNGKKADGSGTSVSPYQEYKYSDGSDSYDEWAGVKVYSVDPATGEEDLISLTDSIVLETSSGNFRMKKTGSYHFRMQFTYGFDDIVTAQVEFVADVLEIADYRTKVQQFLAAHPDSAQKTQLSSTAVDI